MKKWKVTKTVPMIWRVEAETRKEAKKIAGDMSEHECDMGPVKITAVPEKDKRE